MIEIKADRERGIYKIWEPAGEPDYFIYVTAGELIELAKLCDRESNQSK